MKTSSMEKGVQNYQQILQAIHASYPNSNYREPGCPVASGRSECTRGCGGRYQITGSNLAELVSNNTVPTELCGPLTDDVDLIQKVQAQGLLGIKSDPKILPPTSSPLPQTG